MARHLRTEMNPDFTRTAKSLLGKGRAAWARGFQVMSGYGYPKILDAGAQWSLRTAARVLPLAWARELATETANKQHAFAAFQGARREHAGVNCGRTFFTGNPHLDIWRAEGLGAGYADRSEATQPRRLRELAAREDIPSGFLLPIHTGGGLALAEDAVRTCLRSGGHLRIEGLLSGFESVVAEQSEPGLRNATFEALGLVLQTLHPGLLPMVADYLEERNPVGHDLVWHGAGRGHYFDPFQLVVPSALRPQSYLSPTDEAGLNRLSGYAWASTMVNLRSPDTAATVLASLPLTHRTSLAAAADGVSAAVLVWLSMTGDRSPINPLEDALRAPGRFHDPFAARVITAEITRRVESHPASPEQLGALFCLPRIDPERA